MRTLLGSLLFLSLSMACQSTKPAPPAAAEVESVRAQEAEDLATPKLEQPPAVKEPAVVEVPAVADVAVHEWGLLLYGETQLVARSGQALPRGEQATKEPTEGQEAPSDFSMYIGEGELGTATGTESLGSRGEGVSGGKPVLYFYPGPTFDPSLRFQVTVSMPGGRIREVYPSPGLGPQGSYGERFVWENVALSTSECLPEAAPAPDAPACQGLDDALGCEAAELPQWITSPAPCLELEGIRSPVLLYNSSLERAPAPLLVDEAGVHNRGEHAFAAVWVLQGEQLFFFEALPAGAERSFDEGKVSPWDSGAMATALSPKLEQLGLFAAEAEAFLRAWAPLLGQTQGWSALGLLEQQGADALLPLSIEPKPRELRRVLAVVVP
ncbi:MAG: hypothetical protein RBU37_20625 [Myxococcota bacterium]|jgi:hypothetical protein|nr:hypothetical protein [Myxococcota bacterium]